MTIPGGLMALFMAGEREGSHTFDAVSTYNGTGAADQLTHTCAAGTTILVLCVTVAANDFTGTHVEYNGLPMTEVPSSPQDLAETISHIYYLIDPPTGSAYTIDVDNPATSRAMALSASSYISSTGKSAFDTSVGAATSPDTDPTSTSITTGKDGCVIVNCSGSGNHTSMTGNKTLLYYLNFGLRQAGHQYELKATAGSTTFEWDVGLVDDATHVLASFKPI